MNSAVDSDFDAQARAVEPGASTLLEVEDVTLQFGGLKALNQVQLSCRPGEILGLIGPNGAGKTTLLNVISGTLAPATGAVRLDGRDLAGMSPQTCAIAGISRTFQNVRLFTELTVKQNIEVAHTTAKKRSRSTGEAIPRIDDLVDEFSLGDVAHRMAGQLSYGRQRRVEVARALALAPSVMLLDEPAAGMNEQESSSLISLFQGVRDRWEIGLVIIDHDMRFILNVCDRISVLAKGSIIADGLPHEIQTNPRVISEYLGSSLTV